MKEKMDTTQCTKKSRTMGYFIQFSPTKESQHYKGVEKTENKDASAQPKNAAKVRKYLMNKLGNEYKIVDIKVR